MEQLISTLAIWAIPVLFAITLHEAAHGYVARHFGDPTAEQAGRITLNPLKHIDPIGTVVLPLVLFFMTQGGMLFGWAKPVPVSFGRLRRPKADMLWVAAAGPFANLLMVIGWAVLRKAAYVLPESSYTLPAIGMAEAGILINLILMLLNLIPIPPLDGGRIAIALLPAKLSRFYARIEPYGFFIIIFLFISGAMGRVLGPLVNYSSYLVSVIFGL
ncbi:MAG: site-2 protease family protein [Zoogloeaceae bacterium]|nr:site-2 protease family protein [Zoogloeaceae bacterium]